MILPRVHESLTLIRKARIAKKTNLLTFTFNNNNYFSTPCHSLVPLNLDLPMIFLPSSNQSQLKHICFLRHKTFSSQQKCFKIFKNPALISTASTDPKVAEKRIKKVIEHVLKSQFQNYVKV